MKKLIVLAVFAFSAVSGVAFENHETEHGTFIIEASGSACLEDFSNHRNKTMRAAKYEIKADCIESTKAYVNSAGKYDGDSLEMLITSIAKGMVRVLETKEKHWEQESLGGAVKNCYYIDVICEVAPLTKER